MLPAASAAVDRQVAQAVRTANNNLPQRSSISRTIWPLLASGQAEPAEPAEPASNIGHLVGVRDRCKVSWIGGDAAVNVMQQRPDTAALMWFLFASLRQSRSVRVLEGDCMSGRGVDRSNENLVAFESNGS